MEVTPLKKFTSSSLKKVLMNFLADSKSLLPTFQIWIITGLLLPIQLLSELNQSLSLNVKLIMVVIQSSLDKPTEVKPLSKSNFKKKKEKTDGILLKLSDISPLLQVLVMIYGKSLGLKTELIILNGTILDIILPLLKPQLSLLLCKLLMVVILPD